MYGAGKPQACAALGTAQVSPLQPQSYRRASRLRSNLGSGRGSSAVAIQGVASRTEISLGSAPHPATL